MASLVVAGDVSGSVTLSAPSAAGSTVITLPTTSGTMVVTGGAQTVQFAAGSAASPSITFTGDTNTGIFSPAADTIAFSEGGVESMRIDSSGNVGIGTSSPARPLDVNGSLRILDSSVIEWGGTSANIAGSSSSNTLFFRTASTERMRIDSSGNVGIGTTSPSGPLAVATSQGFVNVIVQGGNEVNLNVRANQTKNCGITFTEDAVSDRFTMGCIGGQSYFSIRQGASSMSTGTEVIRITSAGFFKATNNGTYNNATGSYHEFYNSGNTETLVIRNGNASFNQEAVIINVDRNTTNNSYYFFKCTVPGVGNRLLIADSGNVTNSNGSYGTISDIKNKENIVDATPKLDKLKQLQVRNFNFKGDDLKQIGFIAQEFEQVFPSLIEEHHDKDADGNDLGTTTKSIKTSVLVPILVKALQELNAKVEAQAAEIAALKGAN